MSSAYRRWLSVYTLIFSFHRFKSMFLNCYESFRWSGIALSNSSFNFIFFVFYMFRMAPKYLWSILRLADSLCSMLCESHQREEADLMYSIVFFWSKVLDIEGDHLSHIRYGNLLDLLTSRSWVYFLVWLLECIVYISGWGGWWAYNFPG